jgi:hypothetical protein
MIRRTMATSLLSLCLCGAQILLSCSAEKSGQGFRIGAIKTGTPPVIDGHVDDPAWQNAEAVWLKENRSGEEVGDSRLSTRVMTCYDDSLLYIAFVCNDPDIWSNYTQRDDYLWKEEAVEVFIDTDDDPDTYVEIEVSPANILFDSYIVDPVNIDIPATAAFDLPGIRTAVFVDGTLTARDDTDKSWTVEIAVPFRDLATERNKTPGPDSAIRINFYRLDKNRDMPAAGYAWSPTGGRFHKPAVFGSLIFK